MNSHAITLGDRDTLLGRKFLTKLRKKAKFPFLVANLVDDATGKPVFDDHTVVTIAGVKFGLFGVTLGSAARQAPEGGKTWRVEDPIAVAREQVRALEAAGADIIVMLSHLTETGQRDIANRVRGIDVILGGNAVRAVTHPEHEAETFICEAHSKGKQLSIMTLHIWDGMPADGPLVDRYVHEGMQLEVARVDGRIRSYERILEQKEKAAASPGADAAPSRANALGGDYYKKQLVKLRAEKAQLQMRIEDTPEPDPSQNYFSYELTPVDKALPDDPTIGPAIEKFRKKYPKEDPAAAAKKAAADRARTLKTPSIKGLERKSKAASKRSERIKR